MSEKTCAKCNCLLPASAFGRDRSTTDGLNRKCMECARTAAARWRQGLPEDRKADMRAKSARASREWHARNAPEYTPAKAAYRRDRALRSKYGIGSEEFDAMLSAQGGVCAVCEIHSEARLHVDHNHRTGAVRALLCGACNRALGLLREDPRIVASLSTYIEGFPE